jgi:CBS domain-containing protein
MISESSDGRDHGGVPTMRGETVMLQLKDVMSRDVRVIRPDDTIMDAARCMRDGDFGMMPVAEKDRMVGAISDRDITVNAVARGLDPRTAVRKVMTNNMFWAYDDDPVERAAELMAQHQVRRLPIVDHDKRLVGVIALGDIAVDSDDNEPAAEALTEISKPG